MDAVQAEVRAALARDVSWLRRGWEAIRAQASEPTGRGSLGLVAALAAYFLALLVAAIVLRVTNPVLLPAWQPVLGGDGLLTTWQIQAALVVAALPFLFVLLPLVEDKVVAATSTAQVLLAETLIYPILFFGLGGILWTGVAALWLGTDSGVWMSFLLILFPTAVGVGFAYSAAKRIISDPQFLRAQAMELALKILDDALIDHQSRAYANGDLVRILEEQKFRRSDLFAEPVDAISIRAKRDGQLVDVDAVRLTTWLEDLSRFLTDVPTAAFQVVDAGPDQVAAADAARGWWRPLLGDQLQAGQPIVVLPPSLATDGAEVEELATSLDLCLKVE